MPRLLLSSLLFLVLSATSVLGAARELAPRPLGPSVYAQQTPMVAFAGGKYLTVWLESLDRAGWRYLGAFSDAEGNRLSPSAFVVIPYGIAGPGQLIGLGNAYALFFPHDQGVQMFDINLAGQVTATRIIPIENFRADPSVAWNGTHFAVVERHRVVFFDRSGTKVRTVALPCSFIRHELVSVRTDVIVASTCAGGLRADVVASDGSIASTVLDPSHTEPGIRIAAAPMFEGGTLLVWGSRLQLHSAILSSAGLTAPRTVVTGESHPLLPLVLMPTPAGYVLPFEDFGRIGVATLTPDGAPAAVRFEEAFGHPVSAATNGTSSILVSDIYYESEFSRGRVRTRLVDAGAQIAATDVVSITPSRQSAPVLGAGSGTLLALWTEQQGTRVPIVRAAHVAADGTPYPGANRVIDSRATLASDDLSWNGGSYLTVILRDRQLRAQRVTAFGQSIGSSVLYSVPTNVTPRAAVVWAGDRWVVAGTDTQLAFHAEVSGDGEVGSWRRLPLEGTLVDPRAQRTGIYDVALAYDGEQVYIAWVEGQIVPCQMTCIETRPAFIATVSRFGFEVGEPRRISDPWASSESLSLATNGDEVVAVVNGYNGKAVVTTLGGVSRTFDGAGDVEWDGSTFVLALRGREQLAVRRLDANLSDAARPRVTAIAPADIDHSLPSVAVAIPGNAIVGIQEVDPTHGARAVVHVEQELGHEPQRRRIVRR